MPDAEEVINGQNDLDATALFEQTSAYPEPIEWVETIEGIGTRAVRSDYSTEIVDLEQHMAHPRRARSQVQLSDTASFVDWVNRLATPATVVYVNQDDAKAVAVIDDHDRDLPGWRCQRGSIEWRRTEDWKRWKGLDSKFLSQEAFAEHVEASLEQIQSPPAGDLLEIAQTVRGSMGTEITSGRYLQDSTVRITWNETVNVSGGREGALTIPTRLTMLMSPFEGGTPVTIDARLRFRLKNRTVEFAYILDRPREVERTALQAELDLITSGVAPHPVYLGHPAI